MTRAQVFDILFKHELRIRKEGIVNASLFLRREYPEYIADVVEQGVDSKGKWQFDSTFIQEVVDLFEKEEA